MILPALRLQAAQIRASLEKTEERLRYKLDNSQEKGVSNLINKRERLNGELREVLAKIEKELGVEDTDDG
jgi:hypothetical protein